MSFRPRNTTACRRRRPKRTPVSIFVPHMRHLAERHPAAFEPYAFAEFPNSGPARRAASSLNVAWGRGNSLTAVSINSSTDRRSRADGTLDSALLIGLERDGHVNFPVRLCCRSCSRRRISRDFAPGCPPEQRRRARPGAADQGYVALPRGLRFSRELPIYW